MWHITKKKTSFNLICLVKHFEVIDNLKNKVMIQVYYYNFGQKFTDSFTIEQAINEICEQTNYKKANVQTWDMKIIHETLQNLFTP